MSDYKNIKGSRKEWLQGWGFDSARKEKRAIERAFRQTERADIDERILDMTGPDPETVRQAAINALAAEIQELECERLDLWESRDWFADRNDDDTEFYDHLIRENEIHIENLVAQLSQLKGGGEEPAPVTLRSAA
jgi:hypothetical protein